MTTPRTGGVLVVDKPGGPTSHDVVARGRRAFGTRAVGHAGTLDPRATGVLVLAVGEGTKLVSHLTADDKEYETTVALGVETDTLDGEGEPTERRPLDASLDRERVAEVARGFVGSLAQRVPVFSAVKVRGRTLHERARRGEPVQAPVRQVQLHALEVLGVEDARIVLRLRCSKGFYVRALARDLARALGTVGHVAALRRTRSGRFGLAQALPFATLEAAAGCDGAARERLAEALLPLERACAGMPQLRLTPEGREDARHGRRIRPERVEGALPASDDERTIALLGPEGRLVALARAERGGLQVVRGFRGG